MGKTEIEEGECADEDQNIGVDVNLSYIDERLQNVLGHYQKDFEGEMSAESMGPRFGGYGSFLPSYQRSPSVLSCPRSTNKVQNHSTLGSFQNILSKNAQPLRPGLASSIAPLLPQSRTSSMDNAVTFKDHVPQHQPADQSMLQSDHKNIKVRIKVGSVSKPAEKNAAIYCGLGLDMSPDSSPEDSPLESEGNIPDFPLESPSSIIKIMTSVPVTDGALLTPLHDDFVRFMEEKSLLEESKSGPVQELSVTSKNEFASMKGCEEECADNKMELGDEGRLVQLKNDNPHQMKELVCKNSKSQEVLPNSLTFSLTSVKKNKVGDVVEGIDEASQADIDMEMDRLASSYVAKRKTSEAVSGQGGSMVANCNAKTGLAEKFQKHKKVSVVFQSGAKADKGNYLVRRDCNNAKEFNDCNGGTIDPSKQKRDQNVTSHIQDELKVLHGKELTLTGAGSKLNAKQSSSISAASLSKGNLKDGSSVLKKKVTHGSCIPFKSEGDDTESGRDLRNENKKLRLKRKRMDLENPAKDSVNDSNLETSGRESHEFTRMSNEKPCGKNADFPLTSKVHVKGDLDNSTSAGNGTNANMPLPVVAPAVIQENWVCCDKCQKWRLLPYGTNPNHLPSKWKCRMLNWLPGMNNCSFSEQETTNALNALYQVQIPKIENNQQAYCDGAASEMLLSDTPQLVKNQQGLGCKDVPSGLKKKLKLKAVTNGVRHSESINFLNPATKYKASASKVEKESRLSLELNSDKISGDTKPSKIKSKREADQDEFRVLKKSKKDHMHNIDKNQFAVGLSMKETKMGTQIQREHSFTQDSEGDSEGLAKHDAVVSAKKLKNQAERTLVVDKRDKDSSGKKRKLNEGKDSQVHPKAIPCNELQNQDDRISLKEETKENELRKQSAGKESKLQEKDCIRKGKIPDRKGIVTRVLLSSSRDDPLDGKITETDHSFGKSHGNNCQSNVDSKSNIKCKNIQDVKKHRHNEERIKGKLYYPDDSLPHKPEKEATPQSIEKHFTSGSYNEPEEICPMKSLAYEVEKESHRGVPYKEETRDAKVKRSKVEKFCAAIGAPLRKQPSDSDRRERKSKVDGLDEKSAPKKSSVAICKEDERSNTQQNLQKSIKGKRFSAGDQLEVDSARRDSQSYLVSRDEQGINLSQCALNVPEFDRVGECDELPFDGFDNGDATNATKQVRKRDVKYETNSVVSRHPTPNLHAARNIDGPLPIKKVIPTRAANNALREATDLNHSTNQLKVSGSGTTSAELSFQAALKFLHGALLLDTCNNTAKHGEMTSVVEVYTTTAKLCESCAREYVRCKDMASASLAYKCMEVAYLRLVYSNELIASRDQHELQMALQMVPPVESPSSSASGVDNVNNQATVDDMCMVKDITSPQVAVNHVVAAQNRPSFARLLNFAEYVTLAMEASRKSRDTFAAAYAILAEGGNEECISAVKRVLDFSFHDLEGLLHLIQLAMEALSS